MTLPVTLLVVEDEAPSRALFRESLRGVVDRVVEAGDGLEALRRAEQEPPDLVVTDLHMPGLDGLALADRLLARFPLLPIVVVTGQGDAATAVEAMKRGVADFLPKPVDVEELIRRVQDIVRLRVLPRRAVFASRFVSAGGRHALVTASPRMRTVLETIAMVRGNRSGVLIQGETGTGKEVVARAIHEGGGPGRRPFVAVNCAGIPEGLLESQLFGHVKGAFTGAAAAASGLFVAASGGTLFLDEITEMPGHLQAKLLRAIQEHEVVPVGGTTPVSVDARIIAAGNRPLDEALRSGRLREDLFYRLSVVPILLPPLRERPEDIPVLAAWFSARFAEEYGAEEKTFAPEALERLVRCPWPGNIRELRNIIERVYATGAPQVVSVRELAHLPVPAPSPVSSARPATPIPTWEEAERALLEQALAATGGNRSETSRILRIERKRLLRKLKAYGLDVPARNSTRESK